MVQAPQFSWRFLLPNYWLLWLGAALLYLISWLPYSVLMTLGAGFGRLLYKVLKSRRKVAPLHLAPREHAAGDLLQRRRGLLLCRRRLLLRRSSFLLRRLQPE